jgi:DNA-binding response OmpR family regulator
MSVMLWEDIMGKKVVLVVDDSEIVLEMAREALEEGGFKVLTALDAIDADTHIFGVTKPDLLILDVRLSGLEGDKKARMLKENKVTKGIPVVLLSSKTESDLRFLVKQSKADGYIRKPFGHLQLVEQVKHFLGNKKGK